MERADPLAKATVTQGARRSLMSSEQQAAGAEERRPEGFQIEDLVCPDGVSIHSQPAEKERTNNQKQSCQNISSYF